MIDTDQAMATTSATDTCDTLFSPSLVLHTYELLENILVRLPLKDLFVFQRVCKTLRNVISRSEGTRKKMFLLADGEVAKTYSKFHGGAFMAHGILRVNPALDLQCENIDHCARDLNESDSNIVMAASIVWPSPQFLVLSLRNVRASGPSSAHRMLLTQPPVDAMSFGGVAVRHSAGITSGDMTDGIKGVGSGLYPWEQHILWIDNPLFLDAKFQTDNKSNDECSVIEAGTGEEFQGCHTCWYKVFSSVE